MAFGGGTFTMQNKVLPGSYLNFISASKATAALSDRGIVAIGMELDWGTDGKIIQITTEDILKHSLKLLGYEYTHEKMKPMRDLFKHATVVYLYRLNSGEKASCDYATAKCSGIRGNAIKLVIAANVEDEKRWDVKTYFGEQLVDEQIGVTTADLKDNDFVNFKPDITLTATAGINLTGGTNQVVTGTQHQTFLSFIESESFHVLGCTAEDEATKELYIAFTKRLREEMGIKFQTVLYNQAADFEGVISVKNSAELVYWVTGAQAGCAVNQSLTNREYNGEYEITTRYTQNELVQSIQKGEFVFHKVGDTYRVLTDINSLVTTTMEKGEDFKSNQTVRVLDQIGNDIAVLFQKKYLGKIPNDESGRTLLWSDLVTYFGELQRLRAIEAFSSDAVVVSMGESKKSVVVESSITPVNAMEQLYMTVVVE